jgi:hypothetical protein
VLWDESGHGTLVGLVAGVGPGAVTRAVSSTLVLTAASPRSSHAACGEPLLILRIPAVSFGLDDCPPRGSIAADLSVGARSLRAGDSSLSNHQVALDVDFSLASASACPLADRVSDERALRDFDCWSARRMSSRPQASTLLPFDPSTSAGGRDVRWHGTCGHTRWNSC